MTTTETVPELPTARTCPFDPPAELGRLRDEAPMSRFRFPDGSEGWLVTRHAEIRAILADQRFSAKPENRQFAIRRAAGNRPGGGRDMDGWLLTMDPPDHAHLRRLLTGEFTVRRMKTLEPRVEQIVDEHLDRMAKIGPPADLVTDFAMPIPSLVICELLGVPYDERDVFQRNTKRLVQLDTSADDMTAAWNEIAAFMRDLARRKRKNPTDDLLSGLANNPELTDTHVVNMSMLLLIAGHETTANMLALGTFALLEHPEQLAMLRADPSTVNNAVEELLRHLTIIQFGTTRGALEDVEVSGFSIKAGETVVLSLPTGNRDPERFDHPEDLDITRPATGHLTFGHGVHQCLGQQLARIEMRIAYSKLFQRFEKLALAVPSDQVRLKTDMGIYGVHELPVTW